MEGDRHEANHFNEISFRGISGCRWELTVGDAAQAVSVWLQVIAGSHIGMAFQFALKWPAVTLEQAF